MEYPGKEKIISKLLFILLSSYKKPEHYISFQRIGNRPKVHYVAWNVFTKRKKADRIISYEEIIKAIKKTDGRLRECFSTLVDAQPRPHK